MSKKSSDLEDALYPLDRPPEWERFKGERKLFEAVCKDMKEVGREATGKDITDAEASSAARNIIGFFECLISPTVPSPLPVSPDNPYTRTTYPAAAL